MDRYTYDSGVHAVHDDEDYETLIDCFIIRDRTDVIGWPEDRDAAEKIIAALNKTVDT